MKADPRAAITILALVGVAVGGTVDWWVVRWGTGLGRNGTLGVRGMDTSGALTVLLPGLVLAAMLATLSLRPLGRRLVGALAAAAGAGMAAIGLSHTPPGDAVVERLAPMALLAEGYTLQATVWPGGYAVLGGLTVLAAVWLVARPPAPRHRSDPRRGDVRLADSLSSWKAMDAGHDPTGPDEERP